MKGGGGSFTPYLSYIDSRRNYDVILMNQLITQTLITSSLPDGRRFESPLPNPPPILGNYGWFRLVPLPERSVISRELRRWTHQANVYMSTTLGLPFFSFSCLLGLPPFIGTDFQSVRIKMFSINCQCLFSYI